MVLGNDLTAVRAMRPEDAADVVEMARALAAAVGDTEPNLVESDLIRDGSGPERWFDCLVAEVSGRLGGYVLMCKGFEAHTASRRLWLGDFYVRPDVRRNGVGSALMAAGGPSRAPTRLRGRVLGALANERGWGRLLSETPRRRSR
jgi:GNAT superfamily N-acetyltransferase